MGIASSARPLEMRSIVFHLPHTGMGSVVTYTPGAVRRRRSTTRPPPCQAVTVTHCASLAALAGVRWKVAATIRCGPLLRVLNRAVALRGVPAFIGNGQAMQASASAPASPATQAGAGVQAGADERPRARAPPMQPPSTPPARAASGPAPGA